MKPFLRHLPPANQEEIKAITRIITTAIHPEKIILFGVFASVYGLPGLRDVGGLPSFPFGYDILKFLENILLEMKNAGILESKKGKGGGYYFAKNPKDVQLATVIRLLDGPISLLPCVSLYFYERCKNCDEKHCGLHGVMSQVRDANLRILEKKTIADLAKH